MRRKLEVAVSIVSLWLCGSLALAAETTREPAAVETQVDALESAITRAAELLQRAEVLGADAARQRSQLEALRARLAEESRKQAAELAVRSKDLEAARAQLGTLQKQVTELRASMAERPATPSPQPDLTQQMKAKDTEIAELRAEVKKLQAAVEKASASAAASAASAAAAAPAAAAPPAAAAAPATAPVAAVQPASEPTIAPPADGTAIKKWAKPDGTLFFGERPPPGSKFIGYTTGGGL